MAELFPTELVAEKRIRSLDGYGKRATGTVHSQKQRPQSSDWAAAILPKNFVIGEVLWNNAGGEERDGEKMKNGRRMPEGKLS